MRSGLPPLNVQLEPGSYVYACISSCEYKPYATTMLKPATLRSVFLVLLAVVITTGCHAQETATYSYETFRAPNNIRIQYAVHLPEGYDATKSYPAVVAFPSDKMGRADADKMTAHLWGTPAARGNWIVVVPLVPGEDWRTHPNHHALEDLLDHIKAEHRVQGGAFHLVGYQAMGTTIASTWSGMSRKYWSSFTAVSGAPYQRWDDREVRNRPKKDGEQLALLMIYGEADQPETSDVAQAKERLSRLNVPFDTEIVDGDGEALAALANGGLLNMIATHFLDH